MTTDAIGMWLSGAAKEREKHFEKCDEYLKELETTCSQARKDYLVNLVCKANLPLIMMVVKKHVAKKRNVFWSQEQTLELMQEGFFGLRRATQLFEYSRGHKFSTYAVWWIKQSITKYDKKNQTMIHVPDNAMSEVFYRKKHGKASDNKHAPKNDRLVVLAEYALNVRSLDVKVERDDDGGSTLGELLPYKEVETRSEYMKKVLEAKMEDAELNEFERELVRLYAKKGRKDLAVASFDHTKAGSFKNSKRLLDSGLVKLKSLADQNCA